MRREILKIKETEKNIKIMGNKIASFKNSDVTRKGARLFEKGNIYSSSFVGETDDEALVEMALKNSDGAIAYNYSLPEVQPANARHVLQKESWGNLADQTEQFLSALRERCPNFIFSGNSSVKRTENLLNVDDVTLSNTYDQISLTVIYKHKNSSSIVDGFFGQTKTGPLDFNETLQRHSLYLKAFENSLDLPQGRRPVVFITQDQLFNKLLESARIDNYEKGVSLYKGKLHEKILNDSFSLYDVTYDPKIGAMDLFDADGVIRSESYMPLIEKGVLANLICDSRLAHMYNRSSTGNAKRNFDSAARLAFNSLQLQPGERSAEDILKGLPECIVVEIAVGGDFTDSGHYSTPVQNAYLAKHGDIVGRLPQFSLISSVEKMFGDDLIEIARTPLTDTSHQPALFIEMELT